MESPSDSNATHTLRRGPLASGTPSHMAAKKGRYRAKPVCEICGYRSEDREHSKRRRTSQTVPARAAGALKHAQEKLEAREAAVAASEGEIAIREGR